MTMLTVHEFLSRLVAAEQARLAEPRGLPDGIGLGDTGNTDVLQAASPTMHHAPTGTAEAPTRTVGADRGFLGGTNTHAAMNCPEPFSLNGPHTMEFDLATADIFSQLGDVDELLQQSGTSHHEASTSAEGDLEAGRQVAGSAHVAPSATTTGAETGGVLGNIDAVDHAGNTVSGAVAGTGVLGDVSGVASGVTNMVAGVEGGDVAGRLGEVTGNMPDAATSVADLGAVTNVTDDLPVDADTTAKGLMETVETVAPVGGVENTVGEIAGDLTGGDLVGGLGL